MSILLDLSSLVSADADLIQWTSKHLRVSKTLEHISVPLFTSMMAVGVPSTTQLLVGQSRPCICWVERRILGLKGLTLTKSSVISKGNILIHAELGDTKTSLTTIPESKKLAGTLLAKGNEMKQWWQSKTIWGAVVVILGLIAQGFGHQISDEDQASLVNLLAQIGESAGALFAIYGRTKATAKIGAPTAPPPLPPSTSLLILALCFLGVPLVACTQTPSLKTWNDGVAVAEASLATAYDAVATAKTNGIIDAAKRDSMVAQIDLVRTQVRAAEKVPNGPVSPLVLAAQVLTLIQSTLLEIQNANHSASSDRPFSSSAARSEREYQHPTRGRYADSRSSEWHYAI